MYLQFLFLEGVYFILLLFKNKDDFLLLNSLNYNLVIKVNLLILFRL